MTRALPSRALPLLCLLLLGVVDLARAADGIFVIVRRGDNLYRIAQSFDTSIDRIREDNALQGDVIHPGQRLVLRGTDGVKARRSGSFRPRLPIDGLSKRDVTEGYGQSRSDRHRRVVERHTGIDLRAREGSVIVASDTGVVRFLGELDGFGLLLIVEHDGGWRSVYAPCDPEAMQVEMYQAVYEGQRVGKLGEPEESDRSALHFEVRRGENAVDPMPLLRW